MRASDRTRSGFLPVPRRPRLEICGKGVACEQPAGINSGLAPAVGVPVVVVLVLVVVDPAVLWALNRGHALIVRPRLGQPLLFILDAEGAYWMQKVPVATVDPCLWVVVLRCLPVPNGGSAA